MESRMAEEAVPASFHREQKRGSGCVKELGWRKVRQKEGISCCEGRGVKAQGRPSVLANTSFPWHYGD
jgi:hypothetical protein